MNDSFLATRKLGRDRVDYAKNVTVTAVRVVRGDGSKECPCMAGTLYYTPDGRFIGELFPPYDAKPID